MRPSARARPRSERARGRRRRAPGGRWPGSARRSIDRAVLGAVLVDDHRSRSARAPRGVRVVVERLGRAAPTPCSASAASRSVDALEAHDPAVLVGPRRGDRQRARGRSAAPCPGRRARCGRWSARPRPRRGGRGAWRSARPRAGGRYGVRPVAPAPPAAGQSTNSTSTSTPSRAAAARTTVRMELATRPRLPMTRPMSSSADLDLEAHGAPPASMLSTSTASGSSTTDLARYSSTAAAVARSIRLASLRL